MKTKALSAYTRKFKPIKIHDHWYVGNTTDKGGTWYYPKTKSLTEDECLNKCFVELARYHDNRLDDVLNELVARGYVDEDHKRDALC